MDSLREWLYPLGFLSNILFGARFFYQWLYSEKRKASLAPPLFWKLSLAGNLSLWFHSVLQMQFPVALIQSLNTAISWRNLNFLACAEQRCTRKAAILFIASSALATTAVFFLQSGCQFHLWFAAPGKIWKESQASDISPLWHLVGLCGLFLFSSRFLIQWHTAEKTGASTLNLNFWRLSLTGSLLNIVYFSLIGDSVNLIGHALGLIPYLRNIILIKQMPLLKEND